MELSHINEEGRAKMVDVGEKIDTNRTATAYAKIEMKTETLELITSQKIQKGDVLAVAQVGGIMGAKKTSEIIPMCHNIFMSGCDISFKVIENGIEIFATAKTFGKTGIEMEALTAATVSALTIYDMCKAVDKDMVIKEAMLIHKNGGKSGEYIREN